MRLLPHLLISLLVIFLADSVISSKIGQIDKPTGAASNQFPQEPQCQCNSKTIWVDLIFVIDASANTGKDHLQQIWQFAQSIVALLTIEKGNAFSTNSSRVGIVTYGNKADVIQELGSVDNEDLDAQATLPYNGDEHANLELGLAAAMEQFTDNGDRNTVDVIVVMSTTFRSIVGYNPVKRALTAQEDGVVLMVYQYLFNDYVSLELGQVASLDYFFSTRFDDTKEDVIQAICDGETSLLSSIFLANCQCSVNYNNVYKISKRGYPTAGCYEYAGLTANYNLSSKKCAMFDGGHLPFVMDQQKASYLLNLNRQKPYYIGLIFENGRWQWNDGSELGDYRPWRLGSNIDGAYPCAYVDSGLMWNPTECRGMYNYVCEAVPCDSTRYCIIKNA